MPSDRAEIPAVVRLVGRALLPSRALAAQLGATTFEVDGDHMVVGQTDGIFNIGLLSAHSSLRASSPQGGPDGT